jgi:lantibiotic modifying enzyme
MERSPHVPVAEPGTAEFFLEVAARVGERVARAAEWQGEACTWTIMSPDRDRPELRVAKPARASGTFYEGTSGIAVFLAELHAAAGGEELARAALGGTRFALAEGAGLPAASFGLHGGRVGIAYGAAVVGRILGRAELLDEAAALLQPLEGLERQDRGMDVIAGGGGAIPPLLRLAEWLPDGAAAQRIARRLGDTLLATADHETHGWGWGTMRGSAVRHLCGYAHGSAGVGHGLLELWHATGDGRYLYGAEQAFLYERQFFSPESSNWPDLRHTELGEYLYQGRTQELKDRILAGDPLEPQPMRYMSAWCHGAPGIGLTRLRAWELLDDPLYLDEARAAIAATLDSLRDARMNYSLCHGRGGNAETLIEGARVLDDPALLERAREVAMEGW